MKRKKRVIDIYFILYLAAIIFLLPSKQDKSKFSNVQNIENEQFSPFSLLLDKSNLFCRLFIDSSGVKINSIDSINTIFYSGPVKDVEFEFIVEDQSLKQKDTIKELDKFTNKFCRFEEFSDKHTLLFSWNPPINIASNKIYKVTIIALGRLTKDIIGNGLETLIKEGQYIKTEAKFYLNMIYINTNLFSQSNSNNIIDKNVILNNSINNKNDKIYDYQTGEISLNAYEYNIKSVAYQQWNNQVWVNGVDLNQSLLKPPYLKYENQPNNNGGNAEISQILSGRIIITGRTPSHGRMKVTISALFKNEKNEKTTEFYVYPYTFTEPIFDKWMYPEKNYTIQTNLPLNSNSKSKIIIKYNNNIKFISEQTERFQFEPELADTGKTFEMERYFNDNLVDKYKIYILNYAAPIIYDIQMESKGNAKIITYSYGIYHGYNNEVQLEFDGNCFKVSELRSNMQTLADKITHIQYFKCKVKDSSQPFNFKVIAIDSRGIKSVVKEYKEIVY